MSLTVILLLLVLPSSLFCKSPPPFLDLNDIHDTLSEFQFNLIIGENRVYPILSVQISLDRTKTLAEDFLRQAFQKQPDIGFALIFDCRKFVHDMHNVSNICQGYSQEIANKAPLDQDNQQIDQFFRCTLFSPSSTRIREKGHVLLKTHEAESLDKFENSFNPNFLAKVLRNEISDLVVYVEDAVDLDDFLFSKSGFRSAQQSKLLLFDANLRAPEFLKKAAAKLDGRISIAVTDVAKIAAKYQAKSDTIVLLQYDFETKGYQHKMFPIEEDNGLESILAIPRVQEILEVRKYRDILLDFEYKDVQMYHMRRLAQVNELISHSRIIILQVAQEKQCLRLQKMLKQYGTLFNYVCFEEDAVQQLGRADLKGKMMLIDSSIKDAKVIPEDDEYIYQHLPKVAARQQVSVNSQADLCMKTAFASERSPIYYYFNEKTQQGIIDILRYLNSLPEINSILYFCQIYLPDQEVSRRFQLSPNNLFTLTAPDEQGRSKKIQQKNSDGFVQIKMFLRETAISRMTAIYEEKLLKNKITEIASPAELTKLCFSDKCLIAMLETNAFHTEKEIEILKELNLEFSESGYKFYFIDGICHWEVARQLKLLDKSSKIIDRSYLFYYSEKDNTYALWKGNINKPLWNKKDIQRWIKSLRRTENIIKLKLGIDLEDKQCPKSKQKVMNNEANSTGKSVEKPIGRQSETSQKKSTNKQGKKQGSKQSIHRVKTVSMPTDNDL